MVSIPRDNEKLVIEEYREPVYDIVLSVLTGFAGGAIVPIVGYLNKKKEEMGIRAHQKHVAETEELARKITDTVFSQLERYMIDRKDEIGYDNNEE